MSSTADRTASIAARRARVAAWRGTGGCAAARCGTASAFFSTLRSSRARP